MSICKSCGRDHSSQAQVGSPYTMRAASLRTIPRGPNLADEMARLPEDTRRRVSAALSMSVEEFEKHYDVYDFQMLGSKLRSEGFRAIPNAIAKKFGGSMMTANFDDGAFGTYSPTAYESNTIKKDPVPVKRTGPFFRSPLR